VATVVVAGKSEPRCRICSSGKREAYDAALEDYLNGLPCRLTGEALTWDKLAERASVLAADAISVRAARRHLDGHCRVTGEERAAELDGLASQGDELLNGVIADIDALLEGGDLVSPQALLGLQERLYLVSLRNRLAQGDVPVLTHDQGARAAEKLMASAKKAEEATLLAALTGGIGKVFGEALRAGSAAGELPPVVDAEVVAEEEL
jgi:hypothetical protein